MQRASGIPWLIVVLVFSSIEESRADEPPAPQQSIDLPPADAPSPELRPPTAEQIDALIYAIRRTGEGDVANGLPLAQSLLFLPPPPPAAPVELRRAHGWLSKADDRVGAQRLCDHVMFERPWRAVPNPEWR